MTPASIRPRRRAENAKNFMLNGAVWCGVVQVVGV